MAFQKYQSVEKSDVLTPDEHKKVEASLHKLGKKSATDLDKDERKKVFAPLDDRN